MFISETLRDIVCRRRSAPPSPPSPNRSSRAVLAARSACFTLWPALKPSATAFITASGIITSGCDGTGTGPVGSSASASGMAEVETSADMRSVSAPLALSPASFASTIADSKPLSKDWPSPEAEEGSLGELSSPSREEMSSCSRA